MLAHASKRQRASDPNEWTAEAWLSSLPSVATALALQFSPTPFELLQRLGSSPSGRDELLAHLQKGSTLEKLADALWPSVQELSRAKAATASELTEKYCQQDVGFDLTYGDLSAFYGGLEAIVGPPDPKIETVMEREHCGSKDAAIKFTAPNYNITTTSRTEYWFVVDPLNRLARLGLSEYPKEDPAKLTGNAQPRAPTPMHALRPALDMKNAELRSLNQTPLLRCEFTAARLCMRRRPHTLARSLLTIDGPSRPSCFPA